MNVILYYLIKCMCFSLVHWQQRFKIFLEYTSPFCGATDIPMFWTLTSVLGFAPEVKPCLHMTKFSPILWLKISVCYSVNNGFVTHSARDSARHHWHNCLPLLNIGLNFVMCEHSLNLRIPLRAGSPSWLWKPGSSVWKYLTWVSLPFWHIVCTKMFSQVEMLTISHLMFLWSGIKMRIKKLYIRYGQILNSYSYLRFNNNQ